MFYQLIAKPLQFFYELWPSYAGAIGLLTALIMVILLPLTLKGTRSMLAMQKLQPEMKKLQAKHRDDRQKLNEEMMKFYKENNINPVSGCMPLLLQTPVFFFLYRTLYQLLNRADYGQDMGAAVARHAQGGTFKQFGYFRPKHLDLGSKLYQDLSQTRQMHSFGMDLAESAVKAVGKGFSTALPFIILVLLVTATSFIQQRQISARNPQAAQSNPQQALMMKIIPLFLSVISLTLPAGIVVYFLVSNVFRIGQQALITRTMYGDDDGTLATTGREVDKSSAKKGGESDKPKGFLTQLREAGLPDPGQARRGSSSGTKTSGTTRKASGGGSQTKTKAKGVAGATSKSTGKTGATKGGPTKGNAAASATKGTTKPKGPAGPKGGTGAAPTREPRPAPSSDAASPSTRPSRSAPSAPNRARNKKKRK